MVFLLPVLTAALFAAALDLPWLLPVAAMALSWAVHVSFHEGVHRCGPGWRGILVGLLATPVLGLPFDGYRLHHRNHHRHDNGAEDLSRTWKEGADGPRPRNPLLYAAAWPAGLLRSMAWARSETAAGRVEPWIRGRLRVQQALLLLVIAGLSAAVWWWGLFYLAYVWLGWFFVSLHNYGQHPPVPGGVVSVHGRWYNRWTYNNGLHVEHHARPGERIAALEPDATAARTRLPHPLAAVFG